MSTVTKFYPANIKNGGNPALFTNCFDTAFEAKTSVQKLIDNNAFGTANHVIAGFAYFDDNNEIKYVFNTKEEMEESLKAVRKQILTGATRKYAKLKGLKKSVAFAFNFLNMREDAKKALSAATFKELAEIL